jgi:uncharacterized protein YfaS (alpha-2-macroglobulin family)
VLRIRAETAGGPEVASEPIRLKRVAKVMLTSDKPVYQPGQTIHVRSLTLRKPDLKPVNDQTTFSISDPKGNIIFKESKSSSRYGIAAVACPLATEILEGPYTIACSVGGTDSKLTVAVKKYVLPRFKIDVKLDRPYYQPGQKVTGKLHAQYFFGKPVANGDAQIEVRTTDVAQTSVRKLTARTNAAGDAAFEFNLPATLAGKEQHSGDAHVTAAVALSDTAGQQETRTITAIVTSDPLRIDVIPESGSLVLGVPNIVYIYASYADGRPAQAKLSISDLAKEGMTTDHLGVASFEMTPQTSQVSFTVVAADGQGLKGRRHVDWTCGYASSDFLVRPNKAVYQGGDTMHILALGGGSEPVFLDFVKDGQTVLTEAIDMSSGRGECQVDLPPELFGTVELSAYRLEAGAFAVRKSRVIYVHSARRLAIKASLDQPTYRPGSHARLDLNVTDNSGKPVPGALSLAAVDEAVFSVLGQPPGMERTFFQLEQELLRPVYEIYPWSPEALTKAPPEERARFERALFARTAGMKDADAVIRRLLPFLENDWRILAILQISDWEEWARTIHMPAETVAMLKGVAAPHTLAIATFPAKSKQIDLRKSAGLERIKHAWIGMVLFLILAGVVCFLVVVFRPNWMAGVVAVFIIFILLGLLMPSVQKVRSAANRMGGLSALKRIEVAAEHYREAHGGKLPGQSADEGTASPTRVREQFPETLLWRPEVITDDQGHASLEVDLADSITTWRLSASAVAADGRLGAAQAPIVVFQPFFVDLNLPVALTRGDEVAVPVVIYNYLDKPQTVELTLETAPWFERLDETVKRVALAAGEVRSISYRLRVTKAGRHELQVAARSSGAADAIKKQVEVVPDGQRVEQAYNGTLGLPADIVLSIPDQAIEGSVQATLKLYPSTFSQLVEGLDAIFQRPYGCFEQTSSTTYPNVLALDYLRRTNKRVPEVEARAQQYIHLGYQRLLSFEVPGGGFDWFGNPPANRTLTAYGLMEFTDMAKVHDVDPRLIERTRGWLLSQRDADGAWPPESHRMHDDPARRTQDELARLSTTAYIAWAVFDREGGYLARPTLDYLLSHQAADVNDPYVLALVSNALIALEPTGSSAKPYLVRLDALKSTSQESKHVWWEQPAGARTTFYGSGRAGNIETTALAVLAMIHSGQYPETARGALAWLIEQKDASGTWRSTQATVLALKALIAGTGRPLGGDQERRFEIQAGKGQVVSRIVPPEQAEVMQQIDLSKNLGPGSQRIEIKEHTGTGSGYQLTLRYHVPGAGVAGKREPLAISLVYDRTELAVQDLATVTAVVVNQLGQRAPMVLLDLPVPPGFAFEGEDLSKLVAAGTIAKYQQNPRSVVVYLRGLEPGKPLTLRYRLRAVMPVKVTVPAARAYEYYDPDRQGISRPSRLTVQERAKN